MSSGVRWKKEQVAKEQKETSTRFLQSAILKIGKKDLLINFPQAHKEMHGKTFDTVKTSDKSQKNPGHAIADRAAQHQNGIFVCLYVPLCTCEYMPVCSKRGSHLWNRFHCRHDMINYSFQYAYVYLPSVRSRELSFSLSCTNISSSFVRALPKCSCTYIYCIPIYTVHYQPTYASCMNATQNCRFWNLFLSRNYHSRYMATRYPS